jgi:membrane protein DedA with SNARE-associated domain
MFELLSGISSQAMNVISGFTPVELIAIFSIAALTELGVPFPLVLDSLLFLLGFHIGDLWLNTVIIMLVLLTARQTGSALLYWLSHALGSPLLSLLSRRFPSLQNKLSGFLKRMGVKTSMAVAVSRLASQATAAATTSGFGLQTPFSVALARVTPGLLSATSVASGIIKIPYRYFVIGTAIASIMDDAATISVGVVAGYGIRLFSIDPPIWFAMVGIVINIVIILFIRRLLSRRIAAKTA